MERGSQHSYLIRTAQGRRITRLRDWALGHSDVQRDCQGKIGTRGPRLLWEGAWFQWAFLRGYDSTMDNELGTRGSHQGTEGRSMKGESVTLVRLQDTCASTGLLLKTEQNAGGHGTCEFSESTTMFADNNLGEGAELTMEVGVGNRIIYRGLVRITEWRDWNSFVFNLLDSPKKGESP